MVFENLGLGNMKLHVDVSPERLRDRRQILSQFDRMRREMEQAGAFSAADAYVRQAFEILTSGRPSSLPHRQREVRGHS